MAEQKPKTEVAEEEFYWLSDDWFDGIANRILFGRFGLWLFSAIYYYSNSHEAFVYWKDICEKREFRGIGCIDFLLSALPTQDTCMLELCLWKPEKLKNWMQWLVLLGLLDTKPLYVGCVFVKCGESGEFEVMNVLPRCY